ncbi:hypothetical protein AAMO2058_001644400 [Amorphochlora amoebiformis]
MLEPVWNVNCHEKLKAVNCSHDPKHILVTKVDSTTVSLYDFKGQPVGKLKKSTLQPYPGDAGGWKLTPDVRKREQISIARRKAVEKEIISSGGTIDLKVRESKAEEGIGFETLKQNFIDRRTQHLRPPLKTGFKNQKGSKDISVPALGVPVGTRAKIHSGEISGEQEGKRTKTPRRFPKHAPKVLRDFSSSHKNPCRKSSHRNVVTFSLDEEMAAKLNDAQRAAASRLEDLLASSRRSLRSVDRS